MTTHATTGRRHRRTALWLFVGLLVLYNVNGREIGTVDSQPAKLMAREIAVSRTLVLDRAIAERPLLAERPAFAVGRDGHVRSAYPVLPALIAAIPATIVHSLGLVDMDAPLAPNLIAKLTASALTAAGVALVLLALRRIVSPGIALVTAAGLGAGTNLFAQASQTLWAHETVVFGLGLALWAWMRTDDDAIRGIHIVAGAVGLMMAGAARPQVAPLVALLLAWLIARVGMRRGALAVAIVAAGGLASVAANLAWFGHVLGAIPRLEAVHPEVHAVAGSVGNPLVGAIGLLISPSRGLLVFSPIVLFALAGMAAGWTDRRSLGLRWVIAGIGLQFAAYASYSVWWGGHTFGPRYAIDLLVPLAPLAALGVARWTRSSGGRRLGFALLAWSVVVASAGAAIYPNEFWNTSPEEVDRNHARLWQVFDSQIPRTLLSPPSTQTFDLFNAEAVRQPPE